MAIIIVNSHDHPAINSHSSKGFLILKNGASVTFDSLFYNAENELYTVSYNDDEKHNIAILPESIEIIKYG